jgi:opacity protein-like surface antigen
MIDVRKGLRDVVNSRNRVRTKRIVAAVLGVGMALLTASIASAAGKPGYYIAFRSVGGISSMEDVTGKGFSNALNLQNDSDEVAGLGGVIGYKWNNLPLHSEIEVTHRFRFDFDTRDDGVADADTGYEANVDTTTVLFNLLFDFRLDGSFTPYVGGTLGWSHNAADTERRVINTGVLTTEKTATDNLAWGGMAGIVWDFGERWGADFAYRYINLGEVDTGVFASGDSVTSDDYISHDLVISLLYRF